PSRKGGSTIFRSTTVRCSRRFCIQPSGRVWKRWSLPHGPGCWRKPLIDPGNVEFVAFGQRPVNTLLLVLDLLGTFVFALRGATAGVRRRLDIFGVLVLSFVAGNFGGVTRDLMIGAVPPAALADWRYLAVSLLAGGITFYWFTTIDQLRSSVLVFDGAGLALFAVSGTQKALGLGLHPVMAAGIGGGMVRDGLSGGIPAGLGGDLYAIAALAGAAVVVAGDLLHLPPAATMIAGAVLCFGLRLMAIRRGWRLPVAESAGAQ